jgi:hypothetical protein
MMKLVCAWAGLYYRREFRIAGIRRGFIQLGPDWLAVGTTSPGTVRALLLSESTALNTPRFPPQVRIFTPSRWALLQATPDMPNLSHWST